MITFWAKIMKPFRQNIGTFLPLRYRVIDFSLLDMSDFTNYVIGSKPPLASLFLDLVKGSALFKAAN